MEATMFDEIAVRKFQRKYKMVDRSGTIDALYVKTLQDIAMVHNEFPSLTFDVFMLECCGQEVSLES